MLISNNQILIVLLLVSYIKYLSNSHKFLLFIAMYLKPSYFSGTLILAILARGLVIAKFNTRWNFLLPVFIVLVIDSSVKSLK